MLYLFDKYHICWQTLLGLSEVIRKILKSFQFFFISLPVYLNNELVSVYARLIKLIIFKFLLTLVNRKRNKKLFNILTSLGGFFVLHSLSFWKFLPGISYLFDYLCNLKPRIFSNDFFSFLQISKSFNKKCNIGVRVGV